MTRAQERLAARQAATARQELDGYERDLAATHYVWDCITAAWLLNPSVVTVSEEVPISVETTFGPGYGGMSIAASDDDARPLQVMLDLDVDRFYEMYTELLTRAIHRR